MRRAQFTQHASKAAQLHRVFARAFQRSPAPVQTIDQEESAPDTPFEEGAHDTLDQDLRHRMVSEAAYHLYAQRGYTDGYDLDDWLQAEAQVDHTTLSPARGDTEEEQLTPQPA